MQFVSCNLSEMANFARQWLAALLPKNDMATVVWLEGDLGSGKTTFTQAVAVALGVKITVTSPTFVLEKIYTLPKGLPFSRLVHIDCYRLNSPAEARVLNLPPLMADPSNLILIEWAERIAAILPPDTIKLKFEFIDENTRRISYDL